LTSRGASLPSLAGAAFALAGGVAALIVLTGGTLSPDAGGAGLAAVVGVLALALVPADAAQQGWYAGVASGLSRRRTPAWAIRVVVLVTAPLAGLGVAVYALAALGIALTTRPGAPVRISGLRATGTAFLGLAVVLAARSCGLLVGGPEVPWAVLLIGSGLALFWSAAGAVPRDESGVALSEARTTRTLLGLLLALAGAAWVLSRAGLFHQAGSTIAGTFVALAVLALVVGPRWLRTSRALGTERTDRARSEERAELADHLHDSVLQTLALIQRRAADPGAVSTLARRQERELRRWLMGDRPTTTADETLADAVRVAVADIEDTHGARVELVIVGDASLDEGTRALIGATREALSNAARHASGAPISLFAKVADDQIEIFVHDRGPGFDTHAIPLERRGVRESIIARVERHGGTAAIQSAPGEGCEITLRLARN
jgi:signal transduction histidine kinase